MSAGKNLFVGCRVRILYSHSWPELGGQEGTILSRLDPPKVSPTLPGVLLEWEVSVDSWGGSEYYHPNHKKLVRFCPNSDQLEPILPNGLESNEQIDELFEPEPSKVKEKEYVRIKR